MSKTIFTIGHSTRSAEEFLALLAAQGVQLVVDVRKFPASRRYPHFSAEALSAALAAAGIAYRHEPDLGGRRSSRGESPNTFWRNASFRAFADYMADEAFGAAIERLAVDAAERTPAIMCAEAVPWRCHRQLISDALAARGLEVLHILSARPADRHKLHPQARLQADGRLEYPAFETQGELFAPAPPARKARRS